MARLPRERTATQEELAEHRRRHLEAKTATSPISQAGPAPAACGFPIEDTERTTTTVTTTQVDWTVSARDDGSLCRLRGCSYDS